MTHIQPFNHDWEYIDLASPAFLAGETCPSAQIVSLPHNNCELPHNYFSDQIYQKTCGYRKAFFAPADWEGKEVRLQIDGAAHHATVFLNGEEIAQHLGGYTAFCANLSGRLRLGEQNLIAIQVDSHETLNIPPFGGVIDYMTYGGLSREVSLVVSDACRIADVFVYTPDVSKAQKPLVVQTEISLPEAGEAVLVFSVMDGEACLAQHRQPAANGSQTASFSAENVALWQPENPQQYTLRTQLLQGEQLLDEQTVRFGFRTARFEADGFYLNDKKLKLRGLNRHQSYATAGYAMPARAQQQDADICKYELGLNAVRTSHYPQSQHFIDRCDEIGLLVFTELPGWQHIGNDAWKDAACQFVEEMVLQYRNHPSIILWGVRINESQDDDAFYTRTNEIAHKLDPSRQTSGVRFTQKSSLLEDVYSYNDFSHNGTNAGVEEKKKVTPDTAKPYLISEYNGHMFPTKAFDWEEKRLEHALRHARVLDGYYGQSDIAGGFGWCMFDYHTHQDFGSGDRICYHGVMDMYRNPKLAAAVYQSQQDCTPVLEISSSMDIGEHPVGHLGAVYAFTNADSVRLYKDDAFVKEFFPDKKNFPHMPHAPIAIDDLVGELLEKNEGFDHKTAEALKELLNVIATVGLSNLTLAQKAKAGYYMATRKLSFDACYSLYGKYVGNWGGEATRYRFEAIKDGTVVKIAIKEPVKSTQIVATADTDTLRLGACYDVASVRIRALDQNGNPLPFCMEPVTLSVTGPAMLVGGKTAMLRGGMGGTYLKTAGQAGEATLTIDGGHLGKAVLRFSVTDA